MLVCCDTTVSVVGIVGVQLTLMPYRSSLCNCRMFGCAVRTFVRNRRALQEPPVSADTQTQRRGTESFGGKQAEKTFWRFSESYSAPTTHSSPAPSSAQDIAKAEGEMMSMQSPRIARRHAAWPLVRV